MKTRTVLPLAFVLALASCKKSDSTPEGAGTAAGNTPGTPGATGPAAALAALGESEGEISVLAKSKERPAPTNRTAFVKAGRIRFDLPPDATRGGMLGEKSYVIVDTPQKKLYTVVEARRQAVVMNLEGFGQQFKNFSGPSLTGTPAAPEPPPKVTKTGRTDTVAGRTCEEWDIANAKGGRGRVCVASEGVSWLNLPSLGLPAEKQWMAELLDGRHLPLRFIGFDAAGVEENRLELTKIDKHAVPDTTFAVPAGYQVMDMSAMMKGLGGMMQGLPGMPPGTMPSGMPPGAMRLPPGVTEDMMKRMREAQQRAGAR